MPEKEQIAELHKNSPKKIVDEEIREIWRTEYPTRPDPFGNATPDPWVKETKNRIDDFSDRWKVEGSKLPALNNVDKVLGFMLEPANDPKANAIHRELVERFNDQKISPTSDRWALPGDAQKDWQQLLKTTNEQVQRNSNNLAAVLTTTRELAENAVMDGVSGDDKAKGKAWNDWVNSELAGTLISVQDALREWDRLLAEKPLPDPDKLKALADKCDNAFREFYRKHVLVYADDGAVPFVKFQLLATMRSLAEKVASQFAARFGNASFSAAYGLIIDVPRSVSYADSTKRAGDLAKTYGWGKSFEEGFIIERTNFKKIIKNSDKETFNGLKTEFDKIDKDFDAALKRWREAYEAYGGSNKKKSLSDMYQATSVLAVQFRNYQQAVDRVLKNSKSDAVQQARKGYKETLDGYVTAISDGLLIGLKSV